MLYFCRFWNPLSKDKFADSCKIVNPRNSSQLMFVHAYTLSLSLILTDSATVSSDRLSHFFPLPLSFFFLYFPSIRSTLLSALCKRKYSIRTLNSITTFLINPKYPLPKKRHGASLFMAPTFLSILFKFEKLSL